MEVMRKNIPAALMSLTCLLVLLRWWKGNGSQEVSKPGRCGVKGSASWCPEHGSNGLEKGIGGQRLVSTRIR